jgi:hypothetical protein
MKLSALAHALAIILLLLSFAAIAAAGPLEDADAAGVGGAKPFY